MKPIYHDAIQILSNQLERMDALERIKLEFYRTIEAPAKCVSDMLCCLPKVKHLDFSASKLNLSKVNNKFSEIEFEFPFERMSQLKTLRLKLSKSLTKESLGNFLEKLRMLENLESLEILYNLFSSANISHVFNALRGLSKLTNLAIEVAKEIDMRDCAIDSRFPAGKREKMIETQVFYFADYLNYLEQQKIN